MHRRSGSAVAVEQCGHPFVEVVGRERVPDLVFEFVSKSRRDQERDYIFKRAEYHEVGVKEYVIVDRFKREALVLTWQADDFAERELAVDVEYTSPLLPGLIVSLKEVFAK